MGKESRLKMLGLDQEGRIHQAKERERKKIEEELKMVTEYIKASTAARAEMIQQKMKQRLRLPPKTPLPPSTLDKIRLAEINRKFPKTRKVAEK